MQQFEINIKGCGSQNQLAIRLLEIGRKLQLADTIEEVTSIEIKDDGGILDVKIEAA